MAGVAMMATLLLTTACSGDDDKGNPELTRGDEERPSWEIPTDLYKTYEATMAVQVTLQDELLPTASEDDLMCATVGGEVRAVTALQRTAGEVYFPLVIAGNSNSGMVSLHYYSAQLKRIYTLTDWMAFSPGISPTPNEDGHPYVVKFINQ